MKNSKGKKKREVEDNYQIKKKKKNKWTEKIYKKKKKKKINKKTH